MASNGRKKDSEATPEYLRLREDLKTGTPGTLYAFYGQERYLLEDTLKRLRALVAPGTEEFNHHRLQGKGLDLSKLREAVDALPVFSERTLTEISDLDFAKLPEQDKRELSEILSDIPEYATVVFIFDTVELKLDGRVKADKEIKKLLTEVDFRPMDSDQLSRWVARAFAGGEKRVTRDAVRELITMTGGLMTGMKSEVEKLISYVPGEAVDVGDVRAIVTPVPDAAAWQLTDALIFGRRDRAMERLSELFRMNEPPNKICYSVSLKLRQLLMAKICLENRQGIKVLMGLTDLRYEFQARALMEAAGKTDKARCARMALMASRAALALNSTSRDGEEILTMLVIRILADGARV